MWFGEGQRGEQTSYRRMFQRDWTTSSNINNCSTLNSEHNWGTCVFDQETNIHALSIIVVNSKGRSGFQTGSCMCFIVDLLMQYECCCVHLTGRS